MTLSYRLLGGLLAGLALFLAGLGIGRSTMSDKRDAQALKLATKAAAVMRKAEGVIDSIVGIAVREKLDRDVEYREVRNEAVRVVDRPVYRECRPDADGVRLLDRAAAIANRPFAGLTAGGAAAAPRDAPKP